MEGVREKKNYGEGRKRKSKGLTVIRVRETTKQVKKARWNGKSNSGREDEKCTRQQNSKTKEMEGVERREQPK